MKRPEDDPHQLRIDWERPQAPGVTIRALDPIRLASEAPAPLVQRLRWDFRNTFPQPTDEAMDAGVLSEDDLQPANLRSLHEDHERQAIATLRALDTVMDARRRGVDPRTGKPPRNSVSAEKLRRLFESEPDRLERSYASLMDVYENAFGPEAAQAFAKAIRARHAGIEVVTENVPSLQHVEPTNQAKADRSQCRGRIVANLPVPRPLPAAVAAGHFGVDKAGQPLRPDPDEVRAISERHAGRLMGLIEGLKEVERSLACTHCSDRARLEREQALVTQRIRSAVAMYEESFGQEPAERLEAYARRQVLLGERGGTRPRK